jgi:hypothetical protein
MIYDELSILSFFEEFLSYDIKIQSLNKIHYSIMTLIM